MADRKTSSRKDTRQLNPAPTTPVVPAPEAPAVVTAAPAPVVTATEASLKLEQLKIQVEQARLDLKKRQREEKVATEQAELDLRQKRNAAAKSDLELKATRRNDEIACATDAENAEFMFCDGVNWDSAKLAIHELNKISRMHPHKPLTITLNSPGGSVIAGLALYDHIRELSRRGHHITVKCRGMAASMGGILLQAGDVRKIGEEAMVLIHEVSSGTHGKIGDMMDDINFSRGLWEKLAKILSKRSKMTPEEIMAKAHKFDWWLSAKEAVELGFADEID